jgi:hypothetical protein
MRRIAHILLAFMALSFCSLVHAQVPGVLSFQAVITDADGDPIGPSTPVTFKIYATATGVTALWTETLTVTPDAGNVVSIFLGETTPFPANLFDGSDRYLGIEVDSQEMTPRIRIGTTAYSFNADRIDGRDATAFADTAHTHNSADIEDNTLTAADIGTGAVRSDEIFNGAVTNVDISPTAGILASKISGDVGLDFNNIGSSSNIPTSVRNMGSVTISCPTSGYVVLCLTGFAVFFGENTECWVGVGDTSAEFDYFVSMGHIDAVTNLGRYEYAFSPTWVVPVAQGSQTFYALAQKPAVFSANTVNLGGLFLTAVFVPKRY